MSTTTDLVCNGCGESTSSFFIVIGQSSFCSECRAKHKANKIPQPQKPPVFTRYICTKHDCATYSVNNMMFRHFMKDCVIITQRTLGVVRPATYGGLNGDIGRIHFLGVNQLDRLMTNLFNYKKFVGVSRKLKFKEARKIGYHDRKYYNKHLFFLSVGYKAVDYHKNDELFKKLKFNLDVWIQGNSRGGRKSTMSPGDRSKLYYKNLMSNFKSQIGIKKPSPVSRK